jgi:predicted nucleic acid-binding protein
MAKVGIDSNIVIQLMDSTKDRFEEKIIFNKINTAFMHSLCLWEIHDWLAKKGVPKNEAIIQVDDFRKANNIALINETPPKEDIAKFEEKCQAKGIDCHHPDSTIILAFKKEGIEKVYSEDKAFRDSCRLLDVKALRFPMP